MARLSKTHSVSTFPSKWDNMRFLKVARYGTVLDAARPATIELQRPATSSTPAARVELELDSAEARILRDQLLKLFPY